MGDALMELGEYDRAAEIYDKMVELRPGLASYNRVAFYRFVTGDSAGAVEAMRLAIRTGAKEPEHVAWCLVDLGRMLFKTGAIDQAGQAFREALSLFPGYHPALAGLARVDAAGGHFEKAIQLLLHAQGKAPLPEYTCLLAKLYRKLGKQDLAERQVALLDIAEKLSRAAGEAANRDLALAFADLGHRTSRALELARAELDVRRDVYTYHALAWALYRNMRVEEAVGMIRKALSQGTPEPAFHDHAAIIFEAAGHVEDARRHRVRVAELNARYDIN